MSERHIIAIRMDESTLNVLLRDGATMRVVNGIPNDATLVGVWALYGQRCIAVAFEHPSFPAQPEGTEPAFRRIGFELLEHPMAGTHDMIPLKIGMDEREYLDMRRWICERAAEIEGRAYDPKARM